MSAAWLTVLRCLMIAGLIGGPIAYAVHQQSQVRNFRVVRDGVLYRSGQMSLEGLKRIAYEYRIRTVICLRDKTTPADLAEEHFCNKEEISFYRLPPRHWEAEYWGDPAPVEENMKVFREVMANEKNYPVLIHCFAGIHRTGAYCAVYRMEHDHWSNQQALAELEASGYTDMESDVRGYLENYKPTWMQADEPVKEALPMPVDKKPRKRGKTKLSSRK